MSKRKEQRARLRARRIGGRLSKKLVGLFLTVVLALVCLAGRITYINATEGERYSRIVLGQAQQKYESRVIPYRRGDILDRNGTILATSERVYNVILDCKVVNDVIRLSDGTEKKRYYEPTIEALTGVLHIPESRVRELLEGEKTRDSQYQILKKNVSITDKKKLEAYLDLDSEENKELTPEEREARNNVRGVWFEDNYQRVYPLGSLACDTIGFTYTDNEADWGIEGYYSDTLSGTNGRQYGYFNTDADVEQTIIQAVDGQNVVSTIDVNIQQIIRGAIEDFNMEMTGGTEGAKGAENVAVVVMDPDTGEILGMDSTDWYDLNDPRDLSPFYEAEEIEKMNDEETVEALNEIWRNYCISESFEPGSTFKPITAAAALETAAVTGESAFVCDGGEQVADRFIRCTSFHGNLDLRGAIKHSCNDAFMQIGKAVGGQDLIRYQRLFSFGAQTGIDLPGESAGVLFSESQMGETELATSAFGQGFTCTMIQEAAAFSSIINGGNYYKPHVVNQITDASGAVVSRMEPVVERRVVSRTISDEIREDLGAVMEPDASGHNAQVEGYSMGGKTGTAQKFPRGGRAYLVSFIGFAPLDDPEVVVYTVVDEPAAELQDNNVYASKLAKRIFTELLPYMSIFPDEASSAE